MRSTVAANDAACAVLGTLMLVLAREQARSFVSAMPSTLLRLLHTFVYERSQHPELSGRDEILRAIAERLRNAAQMTELLAAEGDDFARLDAPAQLVSPAMPHVADRSSYGGPARGG